MHALETGDMEIETAYFGVGLAYQLGETFVAAAKLGLQLGKLGGKGSVTGQDRHRKRLVTVRPISSITLQIARMQIFLQGRWNL
jgi:alpha-D-ribose 1-methylphosphonate 5-triphosphate synthase subunit PhnG